jgi:hypothetical protein
VKAAEKRDLTMSDNDLAATRLFSLAIAHSERFTAQEFFTLAEKIAL